MSYIVRSNAATPKPRAWTVNQPTEQKERSESAKIMTRRVDIEWLSSDGEAHQKSAIAPAMPLFEDAFCAFAQGTLIQTADGYVAIEDLSPGMQIATADGGTQPLKWIGSMTIFPHNVDLGVEEASLFRLTEGGYGLDRSAPDLMLGPSARLLPGVMATDSSSCLIPIENLADGNSVVRIRPFSPVRVFHICLDSHRLIRANGVLVETFHPGGNTRMHLSHEMYAHFLALFPHVTCDADFGPLNHKR
ncbi:MAG: Hint domain-containing protein [Marinosulfonomonas sp.]|nr:Hint domain-containing protein [Marinosulfonomonas sp.]